MVGTIKYIVRLSASEREALEGLVNKGTVAAAKRKRAHMLLKADADAEGPAWTDEQIAEALDVRVATIHRTRQAYVGQGLGGRPGASTPHRPAIPQAGWGAGSQVGDDRL